MRMRLFSKIFRKSRRFLVTFIILINVMFYISNGECAKITDVFIQALSLWSNNGDGDGDGDGDQEVPDIDPPPPPPPPPGDQEVPK